MQHTILPVILAGGAGVRLWPLSTPAVPKALLAVQAGAPTLLQQTVQRAQRLAGAMLPLVVINQAHYEQAVSQLMAIGCHDVTWLVEPEGRNTAPAIAAAAQWMAKQRSQSLMLILPADHALEDEAAWQQAVKQGVCAAAKGQLVVFGVAPDAPREAYGYVVPEDGTQEGAPQRVARFVEKPCEAQAKALIEEGALWNSGMFVWQGEAIADQIRRYQPTMDEVVKQACKTATAKGTALWLGSAFAEADGLSIDHAVLEKADGVVMIPMKGAWRDLGTFESLWQQAACTDHCNVITPNVTAWQSAGNYVHTELPTRIEGVEGLVVVQTREGLLISKRKH